MTSKELILTSLKKNLKAYELFLTLIVFLEIAMIIYGIISFDFSEWRRVAYMISYVALLLCSVSTFAINRFFIKKEKYDNITYINVLSYATLIIFWSAFVSSLDIIGQGYEVTYMTILAAMASIITINPIVFFGITCLSSLLIIIISLINNILLQVPFYINHFIFIIVILAVQLKNYNDNKVQSMLNKKLQVLAEYDGLTGIKNRRSLDIYIDELIKSNRIFTFAMMDANEFKKINDTYGHQKGDESLKMIAQFLKDEFEHVFRYGGDDFAIVSFDNAETVKAKLENVNARLKESEKEYLLQLSVGIFVSDSKINDRKVFELADDALYLAKNSDKSKISIYKEQ